MTGHEYSVRHRSKSYNVYAGAWKSASAAAEWIRTKSGDPAAYMVVRRPVGEWVAA